MPYFKKSENLLADGLEPEFHSKGGPLTVEVPHHSFNPYAKLWIEAGEKTGFKFNKDYNGSSMEGIGYAQVKINSSNLFNNLSNQLIVNKSN